MFRVVTFVGIALLSVVGLQAQAQAPARGGAPAPDPTKPQKLEITTGSTARYKVTEQLAGISFPSDAVGTTQAITGALIVNPDGSFAAGSKISVDLRTISTDQGMRDNYV